MSEQQLAEWRRAVRSSGAVDDADAAELEDHLRDSIAELRQAGLDDEEAFLIAVRRLGGVDAVTAEYAREHGDRLWKQLVVAPAPGERAASWPAMLAFAAVAAIAVGLLVGFGVSRGTAPWFLRDASFFVLPVLAAYFAVRRRMPLRRGLVLLGIVGALAVLVNALPWPPGSATEILVAVHLPVLLWLVVGAAYLGGDVRSSGRRMEFLRFTGEWAIYYALIALAGGILIGLTTGVLAIVVPESTSIVATWVVPPGVAGAVIVAAWLVEAKKSIVENLAPVLTAIFTPLFAAMLLVASASYLIAGLGRDFDRDLLILFDAVLVVVVGLVIYGISARRATAPGLMDVLRLVTVVAAVLLDLLVVISMLARVGEFGVTANRVVALGLNLVLLVDLLGSAVILIGMLAHRIPAARLERWQTGYLAVIAAWLVVVVAVMPPVFGFA